MEKFNGNIPRHWEVKTLGEVCEIRSGKNQAKVDDPNGKYPIYGSSGVFGFANEYICEPGTTIIGRKGTINNPIYVSTKFWNVDTAFGLVPNPKIASKFLFYFCKGFNFQSLDRSTTIPSLSKKDLLAISLPIPPLPEQQAIVSKVEELFTDLDKGKQQLEIALQQLKSYRQSLLKWAFEGKLMSNGNSTSGSRNSWRSVELRDVAEKIFDGPFGSHLKTSDYVDSGVRVIRLENIGNLEFYDEYTTYVSEEKYKSIEKHTVTKGDIIFSSFINDQIRVTILPSFVDRAINKADCFCIKVDKDKVNPKYVTYYLSSREAYNQMRIEVHGATRPRINTTQLKACIIPLCSLSEQNRLVNTLDEHFSAILKLEEFISSSLAQIDDLRKGILKHAFEGKLTN